MHTNHTAFYRSIFLSNQSIDQSHLEFGVIVYVVYIIFCTVGPCGSGEGAWLKPIVQCALSTFKRHVPACQTPVRVSADSMLSVLLYELYRETAIKNCLTYIYFNI